jgi:hypothetical protein
MTEPTTSEQRILEAVREAGLDPDKPLSEQLAAHTASDDREALTARVAELEAELASAKTDPQRDAAERYARGLRDAQSPWFTFGSTDAA